MRPLRGGNDTLRSGSEYDALFGDAFRMSDNTIGGHDTLYGFGNGNLLGDAREMYRSARGGNDVIYATRFDTAYGDAFAMYDRAQGGNDLLYGGAGHQSLRGDAYELAGDARGGNDTLVGGAGSDSLYGDSMELKGSARGGDDTLYGGDEADGTEGDELYGDAPDFSSSFAGNDKLYGGAGDDVLWGDGWQAWNRPTQSNYPILGGGNDTLEGGSGDDRIFGGKGNDTFVFEQGSDHDIVYDFKAFAGDRDSIDLGAYFSSFSALQSHIQDSGNDTVIKLSETDSITLIGLQSWQLSATDFIF